jgi:hypothetical protein
MKRSTSQTEPAPGLGSRSGCRRGQVFLRVRRKRCRAQRQKSHLFTRYHHVLKMDNSLARSYPRLVRPGGAVGPLPARWSELQAIALGEECDIYIQKRALRYRHTTLFYSIAARVPAPFCAEQQYDFSG